MTLENKLPRSAPEAQGISSKAILDFLNAAAKNEHELHSLMLLRNGHVVAEGWWAPYERDLPHSLYSLSKSFASTAAGMAVEEGFFSLDDFVVSFFPDDTPPEISANLAAMRVRHLLSMSTGNDKDATGAATSDSDGNWARGFLSAPVEHEPGTHFVYNSAATYMVSAIVQKTTGSTLLEFLQPRLFAPLGIENPTWSTCPRGINVGGWGLSITTEDIARFGQLYLQRGMWKGERLLTEAWVNEATSQQVSNGSDPTNDWHQGYGFQFWRCRHGAYRADGAFGQYCIVMPEQNAVLAITAALSNMGGLLNLVWKHLLPTMGRGALPTDSAAAARLTQALSGLAIAGPDGKRSSPMAGEVSGRTYLFDTNEAKVESVTLTFDDYGCVFHLVDSKGKHRVACGTDDWVHDTTTLAFRDSHRVAARGAWPKNNTYAARVYYNETPHYIDITCQFLDGRIRFDSKVNLSLGPAERMQLEGRLAQN